MKMKRTIFGLFFTVVAFSLPMSVQADIAPPEAPPSSSVVPGVEATQVRMEAETVIMDVSPDPKNEEKAISRTQATFTMRNLGMVEEQMEVRFPLSLSFVGYYPEISDIRVMVNGRQVSTARRTLLYKVGSPIHGELEIPWAVFDVVFPPGQDVLIDVMYTAQGYGNFPIETFRYILETGAGWRDSIGSADIIVRLPYKIDTKNFLGRDSTDVLTSFSDPILNGNEARWHFENLEPTSDDNIIFSIVTPSLWKKVQSELERVSNNPNDGEAWGRLAKAYKESIRMPKGYLRGDAAAEDVYLSSKGAYENCLALLPNDSLWHYGYADLLWSKYYFGFYLRRENDVDRLLPLILSHLQIALELDANNQKAKDLLAWIDLAVPDAVQMDDGNITFLGLTATPEIPTPWLPPTEMALPTPTQTPPPTQTEIPIPTAEIPTEPNSLCGSPALIVPVLAGAILMTRRRKF